VSVKRTYTLQTVVKPTYSTVADGRSCSLHCRSFFPRLSVPETISTRYTTADIVLEIGSTSASVTDKISRISRTNLSASQRLAHGVVLAL